jgi:hypothetical protein
VKSVFTTANGQFSEEYSSGLYLFFGSLPSTGIQILHDRDPWSSEFGYFYTLYLPFIVHCSHVSRLGYFWSDKGCLALRLSSSFLPPSLSIYSFSQLQVSKCLQGKRKKRLSTYLMVLFRLLFHLKVSIIYLKTIFYLLNLIFCP